MSMWKGIDEWTVINIEWIFVDLSFLNYYNKLYVSLIFLFIFNYYNIFLQFYICYKTCEYFIFKKLINISRKQNYSIII